MAGSPQRFMKKKLLVVGILAAGSIFAQTRFSVGIGFGGNAPGYYQPPVYAQAAIPPCPGPGYTWVDGYWSNSYGRNSWINGYWAAPPYRSVYVAPRYDYGRQFNRGFDEDRNRGERFRERDNGRENRSGRDYTRSNGYANGFRGR
jgi:hypothetical protein